MVRSNNNPYEMNPMWIKEPPCGFFASLRHLGPGMILSASIVGSGELIATTTLGATAGFITLWMILVSCLSKVVLQLEFGKHTIQTGKPTMVAFNSLPGPKLWGVNWIIWAWLIIMVVKFLQLGGIVGGVAQAIHIAFPEVSIFWWVWLVGISVALLVSRGYYKFIQNLSITFIVLFTGFTILCVVFIQYTPYAISLSDIVSGLQFKIPESALGVAIAVFGITGVGGDEIIQYPYWCIEKGYAAFTGKRNNTPEWTARARGWIRVMYIDALVSMVIYTVATVAFYLLGAAILHGRGEIPSGYAMIETLSLIYTESFGQGAKIFFLIGSVVVLYSTLFAALAAWSRTYGDAFSQFRIIDFVNQRERRMFIAIFAWVVPIIWVILYLWIQAPVFMVILGGIGTSFILLFVVYAGFFFRYRCLSPELIPGKVYNIFLWLSAGVIAGVGISSIISLF